MMYSLTTPCVTFTRLRSNTLQWLPSIGMGYLPIEKPKTDYFDEYRERDGTDMGRALTNFRIEFVKKHAGGSFLVDVGIGGGAFVEGRTWSMRGIKNIQKTLGYDVDPKAVSWLIMAGKYYPLYNRLPDPQPDLSFWDSLEHLSNPSLAIGKARKWVFISIPTFRDCNHVLESKHYKEHEHRWYFTRHGLIRYMQEQGFICAEETDEETKLGREDIWTFAFRRE